MLPSRCRVCLDSDGSHNGETPHSCLVFQMLLTVVQTLLVKSCVYLYHVLLVALMTDVRRRWCSTVLCRSGLCRSGAVLTLLSVDAYSMSS